MPTAERVLIIEDDESLRDLLERTMVAEGHEACAVADSEQAIRALAGPGFDLVLSDFDLPGKGSTEVLQAVRARARDVPVVLITEQPQTDGLAAAAGQGPTHYVTKPVDLTRLRDVTGRALRTRWFAKARRRLVELAGDEAPAGDVASLGDRFDSALEKAYMLCQPIVRWSTKSTFAYEALVRSKEPTIPHPGALFDAGDRLDRVMEIGRRVRHLCGESVGKPPDALLFVNIHTKDLMDHVISRRMRPLSRIPLRETGTAVSDAAILKLRDQIDDGVRGRDDAIAGIPERNHRRVAGLDAHDILRHRHELRRDADDAQPVRARELDDRSAAVPVVHGRIDDDRLQHRIESRDDAAAHERTCRIDL